MVYSQVSDNGQAQFEGEGITIADVRLVTEGKQTGAEARLGIRPQHMHLDPNGQLRGTVTLVERLGTETVVELVTDTDSKTSFRFATPDSADIVNGQQVAFSVDASRAHLF